MKFKLLLLVLALQTAWILGTTVRQEVLLAQGRTVLLETHIVDPRDLLRGDYVILNYKISDLSRDLFSPPLTNSLPPGATVFVALAPQGKYYQAVRAGTNDLSVSDNEVLLKGTVTRIWRDSASVHVEYGLERFYVQEQTGSPSGKLEVQAVVSKSGQARIREVLLDGKPYADVMKQAAP